MRALPLLLVLLALLPAAGAQSPLAKLDARVPNAIAFDEVALEDVLAFLAEVVDTNVVVRWEALERIGVERDTPITLRVRNLRLRQVLWIILNEAGPDVRLGYRFDRDMLLITTAEQLGQESVLQVYNVRDMLQPEIANPSFTYGRQRTYVAGNNVVVNEGAVGSQPITGVIDSGGSLEGSNPGGGIFIPRPNNNIFDPQGGGGGGGGAGAEQEVGDFSDARMQQLIDVIQTSIEPDSWRINGGTGSIQAFNGLLIIRNTPLVHQQVGGALRQP